MHGTRRTFLGSAALAAGAVSLGAQAQGQPLSGAGGRAPAQGPPGGAAGPGREATLADLKGQMPQAQFGPKLKVSRLIIGGNPMGGWAHSRDLTYVGRLMTAYLTDAKISEILFLCEKCGINTVLADPLIIPKIQYHWKQGGKIQYISQGGRTPQASVDAGAAAAYIQFSDNMAMQGDFDGIDKSLEQIRKAGLPAGLGAHDLRGFQLCVEKGIKPDFWMKTFHKVDYWSAKGQPENDNIWCKDPEAGTAFMKERTEPWVAVKTMAAGAIQPKTAFEYAFQNGADFVCAGMFDWQVVGNANLTLDILAGLKGRQRPWRAS
jgi:hypothetical protein